MYTRYISSSFSEKFKLLVRCTLLMNFSSIPYIKLADLYWVRSLLRIHVYLHSINNVCIKKRNLIHKIIIN